MKHHPYLVKYRIRSFLGLLLYSTLWAALGAMADDRAGASGVGEFFMLRAIAIGGGVLMAIADSTMMKMVICPCSYDKHRRCFKFYTCCGQCCAQTILLLIVGFGIGFSAYICERFDIWDAMALIWITTWIGSWTFSFVLISFVFVLIWRKDMKTYKQYLKYQALINEYKDNDNSDNNSHGNGNHQNENANASKTLKPGRSMDSNDVGILTQKIDDGLPLEMKEKIVKELELDEQDLELFEKYNVPIWEYKEWEKEHTEWNITDNIDKQNIIKINKNLQRQKHNKAPSHSEIDKNDGIPPAPNMIAFTDIPPPDRPNNGISSVNSIVENATVKTGDSENTNTDNVNTNMYNVLPVTREDVADDVEYNAVENGRTTNLDDQKNVDDEINAINDNVATDDVIADDTDISLKVNKVADTNDTLS